MAAGGVGRRAPINRSEEVRDAVLDGLKDEDVLRVEAWAAGDGGEVEGEGGDPVSGEALLEGQVADGAAENTDSVTADLGVGDDGREMVGSSTKVGSRVGWGIDGGLIGPQLLLKVVVEEDGESLECLDGGGRVADDLDIVAVSNDEEGREFGLQLVQDWLESQAEEEAAPAAALTAPNFVGNDGNITVISRHENRS